jgi:hypothetical protein
LIRDWFGIWEQVLQPDRDALKEFGAFIWRFWFGYGTLAHLQ